MSEIKNTWPEWAKEFAEVYFSGTASVIILHGNVNDLISTHAKEGKDFIALNRWLATEMFGVRDIVINYDKGRGLRFLSFDDKEKMENMKTDFSKTLEIIDNTIGTSFKSNLPKDPKVILEVLDTYIMHKLMEADTSIKKGKKEKSIAILLNRVELIVPSVDRHLMYGDIGSNVVKILNWAEDPAVRNYDTTIVLITENLIDLNNDIVENPYVGKVEVAMPDEKDRLEFINWLSQTRENFNNLCKVNLDILAKKSGGLKRVNIQNLVDRAVKNNYDLTEDYIKNAKKESIEKELFNLVEFVEPGYNLDVFIGSEEIKRRLIEDAKLMEEGNLDCIPMGYLVCGVIGVGKTFLAKCFAGTIGIPALVFQNIREKWYGASEGNLQKVLNVGKAAGPIVFIIDEAADMLSGRAEESHEVSKRIFGMIAQQMGNTDDRGKIIWMLLTARPHQLPDDLKRWGRCEIHLPLFPPQTQDERKKTLIAIAKKQKLKIDEENVPELSDNLTGAEIEGIINETKRLTALNNLQGNVTKEILEKAIKSVGRPVITPQKELQFWVAIRECTNPEFLPEKYRKYVTEENAIREREKRIEELLNFA